LTPFRGLYRGEGSERTLKIGIRGGATVREGPASGKPHLVRPRLRSRCEEGLKQEKKREKGKEPLAHEDTSMQEAA